MPRARIIKPSFFNDAKIAMLSCQARLLFIGMWCYADDFGVITANPRTLLGDIFPNDEKITQATLVKLSGELLETGIIILFEAELTKWYYIPNWEKHQKVSHRSEKYRNPIPPQDIEILARPSGDLPETLPDKQKLKQKLKQKQKQEEILIERFEIFWKAYPKKVGKGDARKSWLKIKPSQELLNKMLSSMEKVKRSEQWQRDGGQFIPHPSTWLNQERWEDDIFEYKPQAVGGPPPGSNF